MEENVPQLQIDRQYCTVFYIKSYGTYDHILYNVNLKEIFSNF
jgi:hypothetical protein